MFLQEKEYASSALCLNGCPPASNCSSFIELRKIDKLNNRDILRYSRQLILPEIGVKGMGLFKGNVNKFSFHVYDAEMPTSGDLKSGDCLFLLPPPPLEKLTQPPMGMT